MSLKCIKCNIIWNNLRIDYDSDEDDGVCPHCNSNLDLVDSKDPGYIYDPFKRVFSNDGTQQIFIMPKIVF